MLCDRVGGWGRDPELVGLPSEVPHSGRRAVDARLACGPRHYEGEGVVARGGQGRRARRSVTTYSVQSKIGAHGSPIWPDIDAFRTEFDNTCPEFFRG